MTTIDRYFERPILYDILLGFIISGLVYFLQYKEVFLIPKSEKTISLISDLSTISLTLSGFILTFLTVIVTFKSTTKKVTDNNYENFSVFDLFFNTRMYIKTTKLLKYGIMILVLFSILGLLSKMIIPDKYIYIVFYFNIIWLSIISLTMYRNLLILGKIIKLQQNDK